MAANLTLDDIAGLLSGARSKGDYDRVLDEFLDSDAVGIVVAQSDADDKAVTEGDFTGKTVNQIATGLNNARVRMNKDTQQPLHPGGHKVKVIKRKQKDGDTETWVVALVNLAKYGVSDDADADE
jgi:hypothetical protein